MKDGGYSVTRSPSSKNTREQLHISSSIIELTEILISILSNCVKQSSKLYAVNSSILTEIGNSE